jgi:hypothetical protein
VAAVAISVVTLAWAAIIVAGLQNLEFLGPRTDPLLLAMYALSVVAYLGGAAAMVWSAYVTWDGRRPLLARLWTTVLASAALTLLWMAWVYHLMSFQTNY